MRRKSLKTLSAGVMLLGLQAGAFAAEGGSGVYLLGSRGAGAGITPPEGLFFNTQLYGLNGTNSIRFPLANGRISAGLKANAIVSINTLSWVTPLELFGGKIGFAGTLPFGNVKLNADIAAVNRGVSDSIFTYGDPALTGFIGWKNGPFHLQLAATAYLPIGDYRAGELANLSKNRGAGDFTASLTYLIPNTGFDITNAVGITINRPNKVTSYLTGNEFHWEGALTHKWDNGFSLGVLGYHYQQLTGDSGVGAKLGDFKGRVTAVGGSVGYDFKVGPLPVSTKVRYYHEFNQRNRLKSDSVFFVVSLPLWVAGTSK